MSKSKSAQSLTFRLAQARRKSAIIKELSRPEKIAQIGLVIALDALTTGDSIAVATKRQCDLAMAKALNE